MADWILELGDKDTGTIHHVRDAQWLLSGHNVFHTQWLHDTIDGIFGPKTAKASKDCKWDLGYPETSVNPTFGSQLREYLLGIDPLTSVMKGRRVQRQQIKPKFIYPAIIKGKLLGVPGAGTHSWINPPNNWESDNAIDLALPYGTDLLATANGKIGSAFGPLTGSSSSRFAGIRLHLETADNEFYYAHLSSTAQGIGPGVTVKQGQVIGKSGSANGVNHLHLGCKIGNPLVLLRL